MTELLCLSVLCVLWHSWFLLFQLREYARVLRKAVAESADRETLQQLLNQQISTIYRIIGICLGIPPTTFTWEYYQNKNTYASIGPITPLEFYEQHVRPLFDVKEKVSTVFCLNCTWKLFEFSLARFLLWYIWFFLGVSSNWSPDDKSIYPFVHCSISEQYGWRKAYTLQ